eukprot:TRINITY_DN94735_c0_g1_i1.p1 TRINITY_DN94735_c0_g1~~TRINITY_DN94735_c0_g1_i1.p1  ORF type:complete len:335 (-),score=55.24 TRINITY_DN94735_c0_g1_i1:39-1043(-)
MTSSEEIFAHYKDDIESDPNLRGCETLSALHERLSKLSKDLTEKDSLEGGVFMQLQLPESPETAHPNPMFKPNRFKKDVGEDGVKIFRYYRYAVKSEEHMVQALEYSCEKEPSLIGSIKSDTGSTIEIDDSFYEKGGPIKSVDEVFCGQKIPIKTGSGAEDTPEDAVPSLYLGGFKCVANLKFLEKNNIKFIVNTAKDLDSFFVNHKKAVAAARNHPGLQVEFFECNWEDCASQKLETETLEALIRFIDQALRSGASVLVHCAQGKSRSSTAVLAYLLASNSAERDGKMLSVKGALRYVQRARRMAQPNGNFLQQLESLQSEGLFKMMHESLAS